MYVTIFSVNTLKDAMIIAYEKIRKLFLIEMLLLLAFYTILLMLTVKLAYRNLIMLIKEVE